MFAAADLFFDVIWTPYFKADTHLLSHEWAASGYEQCIPADRIMLMLLKLHLDQAQNVNVGIYDSNGSHLGDYSLSDAFFLMKPAKDLAS